MINENIEKNEAMKFINKYFKKIDKSNKTILKVFLTTNDDLPNVYSPLVFKKGLVGGGFLADDETFMTGFANFKKAYLETNKKDKN